MHLKHVIFPLTPRLLACCSLPGKPFPTPSPTVVRLRLLGIWIVCFPTKYFLTPSKTSRLLCSPLDSCTSLSSHKAQTFACLLFCPVLRLLPCSRLGSEHPTQGLTPEIFHGLPSSHISEERRAAQTHSISSFYKYHAPAGLPDTALTSTLDATQILPDVL